MLRHFLPRPLLSAVGLAFSAAAALANGNVYVSRFWHNHQPIYWPEWNGNGPQNQRVQYAWDSIVQKPGQNYWGISTTQHPENNLVEIFGNDDRKNAYQGGPRASLTTFNSAGGFALSYSGALIDNVRQLSAVNQLGYGSGWNAGNREASNWRTPEGSRRLDLVGFTYHHSLAPLLPKAVFRKELQIFKQAWWKAWGGRSDLADHSKGFFPTEMAYSRHLVDVLVDEGYEWVIVASHHISRTSPSYNTRANPAGSFNIFSSPPNKADQLGPPLESGWWYSEPNPGNAAWNVAPYAYQLHKVKYVNPETGAEKTMVAVPSDDVLSYRYGYANEGVGKIDQFISPFASDSSRPVIVMPATDGDNAWGGGSSSWFEATPQLFNESAARGYKPSTPQDFVKLHGASAPVAHIEDGAWIFPEMDYGSPYFLKWIEPPVANAAIGATNRVPGTQIDMETPGFALKFFSYAPLMAGANWCETAEQILKEEGGTVEAWKIQAPYDWDGSWTHANDVELAWHIYLKGLDSGFNYYGGLGNDDEVKPALATKRAVDKLQTFMASRLHLDKTPPTVLKPQRFPYNPGWYTFGWFNRIPGGDTSFLKRMGSDFYIWTHAYDLSGIPDGSMKVKVRVDADGVNPLGSNQNETYAGGPDVGPWITVPMQKRVLPKTRTALNAAASNSQIDYFVFDPAFWPNPVLADYYFAKITDAVVPGFRGKLLDYYVEATDARGNIHKSEIQHVWVEDDSTGGGTTPGPEPGPVVTTEPANPSVGSPVTITYNPAGRPLAGKPQVYIHIGRNNWQNRIIPRPAMTLQDGKWRYTLTPADGTTVLDVVFTENAEGAGGGAWDNNGGADWHIPIGPQNITDPPAMPTGLIASATSHTGILLDWDTVPSATSYTITRNGAFLVSTSDSVYADENLLPESTYSYTVAASNAAGSSLPAGPVVATTLFAPIPGGSIRVVSPSAASDAAASPFLFTGHAALDLVGGIHWSNPATGQSGYIPFTGQSPSGWSWSHLIPLGPGPNTVSFSGTFSAPGTVVSGTDSPDSYPAWANGDNQGSGFGPWALTTAGSGGFFIANNLPNMHVGTAKAFGLWANNEGSATAKRNLPSTMKPGDEFFVALDNNWIQNGGQIAFALLDHAGAVRFKFYFIGGQQTYLIDDASAGRDSAVAYTSIGIPLTFSLTGSSTYALATGANALSGTLAPGGPITAFSVANLNAGPNIERNLYVGPLRFTVAQAGSGTASATAPTVTLQAFTDGIPNAWWEQHFGTAEGASASRDSDGDSLTDGQEYALGTVPTDPSSAFRITAIERADASMTVRWASVPGKRYQIQIRDRMDAGDWTDLGAPVEAAATSAQATVPVPSGTDARFVRVRLVAPPVPGL